MINIMANLYGLHIILLQVMEILETHGIYFSFFLASKVKEKGQVMLKVLQKLWKKICVKGSCL